MIVIPTQLLEPPTPPRQAAPPVAPILLRGRHLLSYVFFLPRPCLRYYPSSGVAPASDALPAIVGAPPTKVVAAQGLCASAAPVADLPSPFEASTGLLHLGVFLSMPLPDRDTSEVAPSSSLSLIFYRYMVFIFYRYI